MLMQANSSLIQPSWTSQQIPVLITQDSSEAVRDLPQSIILTALSCLPPLLGLLTGSGFAAVLSAYVWNKLFTSNLILVFSVETLSEHVSRLLTCVPCFLPTRGFSYSDRTTRKITFVLYFSESMYPYT